MSCRILVGAVSLVVGRVRDDIPAAMRARDDVEGLLPPSFFEGARFQQVALIIRYGEEHNLRPEYQRIKSGALDIAVELEMAVLRKAQPEEVYRRFRHAILEAMIAVAEKYGLPRQELYKARALWEAT